MTIKTILVAASGGAANNGAVELAGRLARRFEAHLEGFHVRADPLAVVAVAADGFGTPLAGEWINQITDEAADLAKKTKAAFDAAAARHRLSLATAPPETSASAAWREETGYAPALVSRRARFFDLVVLGRSDRVMEQPHTDTIEETLLHAGRPVLLAPAQVPELLGEAIAVGWNGSAQAVRALVASLPFLSAARAVSIIAIGGKENEKERETAAAVSAVDYLAWHGIVAKHRSVEPLAGVGPGEQLLATARDEGADLLVMGGYGHSPWREFLFGGATREIVGASMLPLLLSH
jgi:nucleotide-binding universal stress UspA family protein